jgi:hypothetical protein
VCSSLTCKHNTRMEKLVGDKHSIFKRKFVNYGRKKFCNNRPGSRLVNKVFLIDRQNGRSRKCQVVVMTWHPKQLCFKMFCQNCIDDCINGQTGPKLAHFWIVADYRGRHQKGITMYNATEVNLHQKLVF